MGDSERRLMAGRRSVLLGMAGLASAALAACATTGSTTGQVPQGAPTPPAATPEVTPEVPSSSGADSGSQVPASSASAVPRAAPAIPAVPAIPQKQQIVAEFGTLHPKEWGLHVTGVVNGSTSRHAVLTFDACGGPGGSGCDDKLLATLRSLNVPATLFVNSRWITANPSLAAELAADPLFELANHGTRHLPLSVNGRAAYGIPGTPNAAAAYDEMMGNQAVMTELTGTAPRFFRPGTAFYDDVAAAMTRRCGMLPVNFTVNGDGGATFGPAAVAAEVGRVGSGDIVISHFNRPASGTAEGYARSLPLALDRGVTFARLGDVLPI